MKDNSFRLSQFNFSSSTFEIVKFKSIDTFPRQKERYVFFFSTNLLQLARLNSDFLTFFVDAEQRVCKKGQQAWETTKT